MVPQITIWLNRRINTKYLSNNVRVLLKKICYSTTFALANALASALERLLQRNNCKAIAPVYALLEKRNAMNDQSHIIGADADLARRAPGVRAPKVSEPGVSAPPRPTRPFQSSWRSLPPPGDTVTDKDGACFASAIAGTFCRVLVGDAGMGRRRIAAHAESVGIPTAEKSVRGVFPRSARS